MSENWSPLNSKNQCQFKLQMYIIFFQWQEAEWNLHNHQLQILSQMMNECRWSKVSQSDGISPNKYNYPQDHM